MKGVVAENPGEGRKGRNPRGIDAAISNEWREWLGFFRELISETGLTQGEIAATLKMSEGHFSQILSGSGRFLQREALEHFFLVCRPDVTADVRDHALELYMTALSWEPKFRELYQRYRLLDRYDALQEEASRRAENVRRLEAEHAGNERRVLDAHARLAELVALQRAAQEEHEISMHAVEARLREQTDGTARTYDKLAAAERRVQVLEEEVQLSGRAVAEARQQRDDALLETAGLREELAAAKSRTQILEERETSRQLADAVVAEAQHVVDHAGPGALSVVSRGETTTSGAGQHEQEAVSADEPELWQIVTQLQRLRGRDLSRDEAISGHSLANRRIDELVSWPRDRRLQLVAMLSEAGQHIDAARLEALPKGRHTAGPSTPLRRPPQADAGGPPTGSTPPESTTDRRERERTALAELRAQESATPRNINELKARAAQRPWTEVVELHQRLQRDGRHSEAEALRSGTSERSQAERRHIADHIQLRQH
ncbi:hypothetical protein ACWEWD_32850 [Streptomyces tendae]